MYDELQLDTLGDKKTALFLIMSDTDSTFNFLISIVKLLNALNISADTLLCDLVPSASHVTDDEIRKRLEHLTPVQKKAALDLLDTYIGNLPYLTNEE